MIIWIKSSLNFLCVVHSLFPPPPLRAAALCCRLVCMVGAPCYVLFCLVWSVWVWSACMCHLFSVWLSVMVLRGGGRQRINSRISNTGKDSMAAKWNTAFLLDCESGCWRSAAPVLKWLGRGQSQGGRDFSLKKLQRKWIGHRTRQWDTIDPLRLWLYQVLCDFPFWRRWKGEGIGEAVLGGVKEANRWTNTTEQRVGRLQNTGTQCIWISLLIVMGRN